MHARPQTVQYTQRVHERPVVECNLVSGLCFTFNGGECLIVPKAVRAYDFPVTYRVRDLNNLGGDMFEAVMEGSDGSILKFCTTTDDVMHSIDYVQPIVAQTLRMVA